MKRLYIFFVILLVFSLVSCNQEELDNANNKVLELNTALKKEKENLSMMNQENIQLKKDLEKVKKENKDIKNNIKLLEERIESAENKLIYFMNLNDTEIIGDSIYKLKEMHNIIEGKYQLTISEINLKDNKVYFELVDSNMRSFTVSDDNKYIMVNYLYKTDPTKQAIKLFDHDQNLIYSYYYDELVDYGMFKDDIIHKGYFSDNNDYYYGAFGSEVDISQYFIINIRTGDIIVYSDENMDRYHYILKVNPSSRLSSMDQ